MCNVCADAEFNTASRFVPLQHIGVDLNRACVLVCVVAMKPISQPMVLAVQRTRRRTGSRRQNGCCGMVRYSTLVQFRTALGSRRQCGFCIKMQGVVWVIAPSPSYRLRP